MRKNLVLIHGWGLNEAIWCNLSNVLKEHYDLHLLSMPGYGKLHGQPPADTLDTLANALLQQAPDSAIWCGWSLGGMAAIRAAQIAPKRIQSLYLLCSTPKFVTDKSWPYGTDIETFVQFAEDLTKDYQRGIQRFLLLQAGTSSDAKSTVKQAAKALNKYPVPSPNTLMSGLDILKSADLRAELADITLPCHVIGGRRDRVVAPEATRYLSEKITGARYSELNTGHAPHLSHPDALLSVLINDVHEHVA